MRSRVLAGVVAAAAFSTMTGVAAATTFSVGSATEPSGGSTLGCGGAGIWLGVGPASELLPAGGEVTQWQADMTGATAGKAIELVAASPLGGGLWKIDAIDAETVPSPATGIATFTPSSPMMVSDGDALGVAGDSSVTCGWSAASALSDTTNYLLALVPSVGEAYEADSLDGTQNLPGVQENFSATVVATEDSSVSTSTQPQTVSAGSDAVLSSTVTDNGPASNPLTFTDTVPSGLAIDAVDSAAGTCTTSGQQVSCTLAGLHNGQSAVVNVIVTAAVGTYSNSVSVSQPSAATDPVTSNNSATGSLTANAVTVAACHVPTLAKLPLATAKSLLGTLGCTAGKVTKSYSSVTKGDVIKTTPGKGTYAAAASIAISESKGPKPKKKHHTLSH